jgi:hypothetical protein
MRRVATAILFCSAVMTAGAIAGIATADPTGRFVRYTGTVPGDSLSEGIKLKVKKRVRDGPDVNRGVEFSGSFTKHCDDGTVRRGGTISSIGFDTKRRFRGKDEDFLDGDYSVTRLKGRLLGDGRARGWVSDVDQFQEESRPDCTTDGRLRWRAERVR